MGELGAAGLLISVAVAVLAGLYAVGQLVSVVRAPFVATPFLSGHPPTEHAVSRYHPRWYAITLLFLAFDMEMVFMYPWALVVADIGPSAVIEMFGFLGILLVGVLYAWREGALRWT